MVMTSTEVYPSDGDILRLDCTGISRMQFSCKLYFFCSNYYTVKFKLCLVFADIVMINCGIIWTEKLRSLHWTQLSKVPSDYSFVCFANCWEFCLCSFCPPGSFRCIFSPTVCKYKVVCITNTETVNLHFTLVHDLMNWFVPRCDLCIWLGIQYPPILWTAWSELSPKYLYDFSMFVRQTTEVFLGCSWPRQNL